MIPNFGCGLISTTLSFSPEINLVDIEYRRDSVDISCAGYAFRMALRQNSNGF